MPSKTFASVLRCDAWKNARCNSSALSGHTPWQASPDHETSRAATGYGIVREAPSCVGLEVRLLSVSVSLFIKIQYCIKYFAKDLSYISSFMKKECSKPL